MDSDTERLRNTACYEVGATIRRDADLIVEQWVATAVEAQSSADYAHRAEIRNALPRFLRELGDLISTARPVENAPDFFAEEHGEQRWEHGWRLDEVIRDYQLLRIVTIEHLVAALRRDLTTIETLTLGNALDEAIMRGVLAFVRHSESSLLQTNALLEDANKQLTEAVDVAQRASESKSEYLALMSHEIRTPMTAILGFAEIVESEQQDSEAIRIIRRNGEYLLDIINGILDLSKIEAGKFAPSNEPFSPHAVLSDVQSLLQILARESRTEVLLEIDPSLPHKFCSDAVRLRQILVNLVGNAIKFSDGNPVRMVARSNTIDRAAALQIYVIDAGVGMSATDAQRLFEPYEQADQLMVVDRDKPRIAGTGLGLTVSKGLAEMLGGALEVDSEAGRGTTFRLTIPDQARATDKSQLLNRDRPCYDADSPELASHAINGSRVLVAEDTVANQKLIELILSRAGATVEVVADGAQAIDAVKTAQQRGQPFSVVLMDVVMPRVDGHEATRRLRAAGCDVPIVALTAHAFADDREAALSAGCDEYLSKPIDQAELLNTVNRFSKRRDA